MSIATEVLAEDFSLEAPEFGRYEIPLDYQDTVSSFVDRFNEFFSRDVDQLSPDNKETHDIAIGHVKAKVVKYSQGEDLVHSLEIPLKETVGRPSWHPVEALNITTAQDGSLIKADKETFHWRHAGGERYFRPGKKEVLDRGDYHLLSLARAIMSSWERT